MRCCIGDRGPSVFESRGIGIADDCLLFSFRRIPADPVRSAIGKVPAKEELESNSLAGPAKLLETKHADRIVRIRLRA